MLWALVSSAFVLYLYRTLNAQDTLDEALPVGSPQMSELDAELAKLNERIGLLESRVFTARAQGTES